MKMLTIRLSEELHKSLKMLCVSRGVTMISLILSLIEKEVKNAENNRK